MKEEVRNNLLNCPCLDENLEGKALSLEIKSGNNSLKKPFTEFNHQKENKVNPNNTELLKAPLPKIRVYPANSK